MPSNQTFLSDKDHEVAPKLDGLNCIKHDFNSAGLITTDTAEKVFDQPHWKAFINGLPTIEFEQAGLLRQVSQDPMYGIKTSHVEERS